MVPRIDMTLQWCCIRWWRFSSILHGLMCDTRPDKEQLPQAGWKNCYRNSQTGSNHLICRKPITDIKVKEQRSSLQCAEQLLLNAGAAWEGKSQSSYSAGRRDMCLFSTDSASGGSVVVAVFLLLTSDIILFRKSGLASILGINGGDFLAQTWNSQQRNLLRQHWATMCYWLEKQMA